MLIVPPSPWLTAFVRGHLEGLRKGHRATPTETSLVPETPLCQDPPLPAAVSESALDPCTPCARAAAAPQLRSHRKPHL